MDGQWVAEVVLVNGAGARRLLAVHNPSTTPPSDVRIPHPQGEFVFVLSGNKDAEGRWIYIEGTRDSLTTSSTASVSAFIERLPGSSSKQEPSPLHRDEFRWTGLVCRYCDRAVAIVANQLPMRVVCFCPACGHRWAAEEPGTPKQ